MTKAQHHFELSIIKFLRKIENHYSEREIWIYLDNFRLHKSKRVTNFLKKHNRIKLEFLPPNAISLHYFCGCYKTKDNLLKDIIIIHLLILWKKKF
ncbi:MAG: transposase [Candidatus Aenigmarchaeota archaeon]|nr:transposase [Candidatus Aenigmarchaeota archaeon]